MRKDRGTATLTACCPTCNAEHSAATLNALTKAVQGCCASKKPRSKIRDVSYIENRALPDLPLVFDFDRIVSSQNKSTYSHWSKYKRDKRGWTGLTSFAFRHWYNMRLPWSRWRLERIWCAPKREYDFANFVGGAKPLIDCLIDHGLIYDDDPKHFTCEYEQIPGESNHTRLILLEV